VIGQKRSSRRERATRGSSSREAPLVPGGRTHRDIRGGAFRAGIFGVSDGLVSNVSLVLGTAGAHPAAGIVRLAGLAGLFGGAFSMAAGEWVSMSAQREALERELDVEREELAEKPHAERAELERIYVGRGVTPEVAARVAGELMADPETALATHAREELGIDTSALGSPVSAAISSFLTFGIGATVPLAPFLGGSSSTPTVLLAIGLTALAALAVGVALSYFTSRSKVFSALRMLGICALAGAATFGIGSAIGATTG
jgi:VIT1/CCC1 family predicted Fe2+/Mn2+ transporter